MCITHKNKLKIGVIGLGVGQKHILAFQNHSYCEIVALCDFSAERRSHAEKYFTNVKLAKKADEILDDPEIDVVSIASYDNYHFEQVVKAINRKKHVFVEKPLCLYAKQASEIRKLLDNNTDLHLSSNLNLRTCPRFIRIKKAISSGEMGNIFYLEGDYLWGRIEKLTNGWRKDMEVYSILYGAAVHIIDLIMWLIEDKPVEVFGYGNAIATSGSGFKHNDFAAILMKFQNGVVAKASSLGGCAHPHFHKISIYGTKKTFIHNEMGAKLFEQTDAGVKAEDIMDDYPANQEKLKIITTFIDSIIDPKAACIVPTEDVFATMSVCFAAEKAIKEGKPVKVEYI